MRNRSVTATLLVQVMRVIDEVVDAPLRVMRWFYRNFVNSMPRLYQSREHDLLYNRAGDFVDLIWDGEWKYKVGGILFRMDRR